MGRSKRERKEEGQTGGNAPRLGRDFGVGAG